MTAWGRRKSDSVKAWSFWVSLAVMLILNLCVAYRNAVISNEFEESLNQFQEVTARYRLSVSKIEAKLDEEEAMRPNLWR